MSQLLIGRELPNLKITLGVDNKNEEEEDELEIDVSGDEDEEHEQNDKQENKQPTTTLPAEKPVFEEIKPKKYENRGGAFITGLDLSSEAVQQKLEKRAHRFGLEGISKHPITQAEIDSLYTSLGIDVKNVKASGKASGIRLDAIHMRGVNEMSTQDVFDYFKEFGPSSVEWINDYSCNVLWLDEVSACRALLTLSRLLIIRHRRKSENSAEKKGDAATEEEEKATEFEENEVVIMSEDESSDGDDDEDNAEPPQPSPIKEEKMEVDQPSEELPSEDVKKPDTEETKPLEDPSTVDVPVPPGYWRLGIPYPKAKALLLRFATKDDKKLPGAEKRSQYYQKYGNPNYGGLRGLISTSRKRRFFQVKQRQVSQKSIEGDTSSESSHQSENSETESNKGNDPSDSVKRLRMRMYADDEEKKRKKRIAAVTRARNQQRNRRSPYEGNSGRIQDRLGRSKLEVSVINQDSASEYSDDSRDSREAHYDDDEGHMAADKETHRSSVWKRLADNKPSRSKRDTRTSSLSKRADEVDLRYKIGLSSQSQSVAQTTGDLRSRLNQLRKEREIKHRSPLLIQVENDQEDSDT